MWTSRQRRRPQTAWRPQAARTIAPLIQFYGDIPNASTFMSGNAAFFASTGFDGAVVDPDGYLPFRTVASPTGVYAPINATMASWDGSKRVYLRINSTCRGPIGAADNSWDWNNKAHTSAALSNWSNLLTNVSKCHAAGIMFDPEGYSTYGFSPWEFAVQCNPGLATFDQMRAAVKAFGVNLGERIDTICPSTELVFAVGLSAFLAKYAPNWKPVAGATISHADLQANHYGLLPAFIEGLLDGSTTVRIVDGGEPGYWTQTAQQCAATRAAITSVASAMLLNPESAAKWNSRASAGHFIYLNPILRSASDFSYLGYWFANRAERMRYFRYLVYVAVISPCNAPIFIYRDSASDGTWAWAGTMPADLLKAFKSAKTLAASGQAFDDPAVEAMLIPAAMARKALGGTPPL